MNKWTKSDLLREFEKHQHLPGDEAKPSLQDNPMNTAYTVDTMWTIRKLKETTSPPLVTIAGMPSTLLRNHALKVKEIDCILTSLRNFQLRIPREGEEKRPTLSIFLQSTKTRQYEYIWHRSGHLMPTIRSSRHCFTKRWSIQLHALRSLKSRQ